MKHERFVVIHAGGCFDRNSRGGSYHSQKVDTKNFQFARLYTRRVDAERACRPGSEVRVVTVTLNA